MPPVNAWPDDIRLRLAEDGKCIKCGSKDLSKGYPLFCWVCFGIKLAAERELSNVVQEQENTE
jgi:hypothetical protein